MSTVSIGELLMSALRKYQVNFIYFCYYTQDDFFFFYNSASFFVIKIMF